MNTRSICLLGISCYLGMASAQADTGEPWIARLGYARASFSPEAKLSLAGNSVPGAEVEIPDRELLMAELGYEFADGWVARIALAPPPTVTVFADGSLKGFTPPLTGTVAKARIAPVLMTVTYSPGSFHGIAPYVGAGVNYTIVMDTWDGDVASIDVKNAWGPVFQVGADLAIDRNWSAYLDARKVYVTTTGTGIVPAFGGMPVRGEVTINPLIVSVGLSYRF